MSRHSPAGVGTSPSAIPIINVTRGGLEQTLDRIDPIVLRRYLDQLPSPAVAGIIAGSLTENSVIVACLTSAGTVVKGWNDFKKYSFKVDVCRFAYTSYDKTLIELRTYARGLPMDELEGFLIKMQTLDDTITDFTPPVADKYVQAYERQHDKSEDVDRDDNRTMRRKKRVTQRRRRAGRRRIGQKGGILPLAALIPALIAGGKAIALGAASGAAGWGAKKALDAATRKKKR
ncbi:hypothetical protein ACROYT_G039477 [Oculina patagonica]